LAESKIRKHMFLLMSAERNTESMNWNLMSPAPKGEARRRRKRKQLDP
jgi:hypothetical protein